MMQADARHSSQQGYYGQEPRYDTRERASHHPRDEWPTASSGNWRDSQSTEGSSPDSLQGQYNVSSQHYQIRQGGVQGGHPAEPSRGGFERQDPPSRAGHSFSHDDQLRHSMRQQSNGFPPHMSSQSLNDHHQMNSDTFHLQGSMSRSSTLRSSASFQEQPNYESVQRYSQDRDRGPPQQQGQMYTQDKLRQSYQQGQVHSQDRAGLEPSDYQQGKMYTNDSSQTHPQNRDRPQQPDNKQPQMYSQDRERANPQDNQQPQMYSQDRERANQQDHQQPQMYSQDRERANQQDHQQPQMYSQDRERANQQDHQQPQMYSQDRERANPQDHQQPQMYSQDRERANQQDHQQPQMYSQERRSQQQQDYQQVQMYSQERTTQQQTNNKEGQMYSQGDPRSSWSSQPRQENSRYSDASPSPAMHSPRYQQQGGDGTFSRDSSAGTGPRKSALGIVHPMNSRDDQREKNFMEPLRIDTGGAPTYENLSHRQPPAAPHSTQRNEPDHRQQFSQPRQEPPRSRVEPVPQTRDRPDALLSVAPGMPVEAAHMSNRDIETIKEDPDMDDTEILSSSKLAELRNQLNVQRLRLSISATDLIGKSHEELVLLLIQLRRSQSRMENLHKMICKKIDSAPPDQTLSSTEERNWNELRQQSNELDRQLEVIKPLVNLLHNMVTMGSIYGGNNLMMASQYKRSQVPPDQYTPPKKMIEFSRVHQEEQLAQKMEADMHLLSKDEVDLEKKLEKLYALDQQLQQTSFNVSSLQEDKMLLEKALEGCVAQEKVALDHRDRARLQEERKSIEAELSRVRQQLVEESRKLEDTAAENAKVEHEFILLRKKIYGLNQGPTSPTTNGDSQRVRMKIEKELDSIQSVMDGLSKQKEQLSEVMDTLKPNEISPGLDQPTGAKYKPYTETDLDTLHSVDIAMGAKSGQLYSPEAVPGGSMTRKGEGYSLNSYSTTYREDLRRSSQMNSIHERRDAMPGDARPGASPAPEGAVPPGAPPGDMRVMGSPGTPHRAVSTPSYPSYQKPTSAVYPQQHLREQSPSGQYMTGPGAPGQDPRTTPSDPSDQYPPYGRDSQSEGPRPTNSQQWGATTGRQGAQGGQYQVDGQPRSEAGTRDRHVSATSQDPMASSLQPPMERQPTLPGDNSPMGSLTRWRGYPSGVNQPEPEVTAGSRGVRGQQPHEHGRDGVYGQPPSAAAAADRVPYSSAPPQSNGARRPPAFPTQPAASHMVVQPAPSHSQARPQSPGMGGRAEGATPTGGPPAATGVYNQVFSGKSSIYMDTHITELARTREMEAEANEAIYRGTQQRLSAREKPKARTLRDVKKIETERRSRERTRQSAPLPWEEGPLRRSLSLPRNMERRQEKSDRRVSATSRLFPPGGTGTQAARASPLGDQPSTSLGSLPRQPRDARPARAPTEQHRPTQSEMKLRSRSMTLSSLPPLQLERSARPARSHSVAGDLISSREHYSYLKRTDSADDLNADMIDREILFVPEKVFIPERYVPDTEDELSETEQMRRDEKAGKIRRMLAVHSLQEFGPEEISYSRGPYQYHVEEERKSREHILELKQALAKQVTQKSKEAAERFYEEQVFSPSLDSGPGSPPSPRPQTPRGDLHCLPVIFDTGDAEESAERVEHGVYSSPVFFGGPQRRSEAVV